MKIKKFFLLFLLIFSINIGYASNKISFTEISFEGLERISQKLALSYITFHTNELISNNEIENSVKKLLSSQKFQSVKFFQLNNKIIFKVKEFPILSKISIQGNYKIDENIIRNLLNKSHIFKEQFFNKKNLLILKKEILNYCSQILRNHVLVNLELLDKEKNTKELKISILDQGLTYINKLTFLDNKNFDTDKLLNLFNFYEQSFFFKKKSSDHFSYENFQTGLEKLYHFYNSQGYLNFHIVNTELKYFNNKNNVNIILKLHEGSRYVVSSILIHEIKPYIIKNSNVLSCIKLNKLYNIDDFFLLKNKIQDILLRNGYLYSNISIIPTINKFKKTVIFNINIDKKDACKLNTIRIKGNDFITEQDLINIVYQKKNSILNIDLIKRDLKALQDTNFFDQISFEFKPALFQKSSCLDLIYLVHEKKSNTFNFGFGYNTLNQLNYNFQFKKNHFFGMGKSFSIDLDKSFNKSNMEICYQDPYFTINKFFLVEKIFANIDESSSINNLYNNVNFSNKKLEKICNTFMDLVKNYKLSFKNKILNYGIEQSLGISIFSKFIINTSIGYKHNEVRSIFNDKIINTNIDLNQNTFNIINTNQIFHIKKNFYINNSIYFNQLNDSFFPNFGNELEFSIKYFFPIVEKSSIQFMYNSKQYFPIIKKNNLLTLFIHSYFGCEISSVDNLLFSNFTNLYNNNNNSIRGYISDKIGPKILKKDTIFNNEIDDFDLNQSSKELIYKKNDFFNHTVGGNVISINSIELISSIPIIENKYSRDFRISLFLDFGNIYKNNFFVKKDFNKNFIYFNPKSIYSSYGCSLRWKSPFGLISVSYAFPIGKHNFEDLERFQIRFGS
ncbi:outer membrane protein assembly factor BamA [Buchnera aphidicola]|uniref:outer membrane protein assembly factor BamA n=1 Tax=Buchnera aphidicola TaxID=9 RepID=UPI002237DB6E|nr:outer membrane protein assembly factor BamA [Buchnera aphidicola]MCW5197661.1 outer membrane protein assembly factor BamA [Buchnera aphidicola (Chaitophorus viminalis)]